MFAKIRASLKRRAGRQSAPTKLERRHLADRTTTPPTPSSSLACGPDGRATSPDAAPEEAVQLHFALQPDPTGPGAPTPVAPAASEHSAYLALEIDNTVLADEYLVSLAEEAVTTSGGQADPDRFEVFGLEEYGDHGGAPATLLFHYEQHGVSGDHSFRKVHIGYRHSWGALVLRTQATTRVTRALAALLAGTSSCVPVSELEHHPALIPKGPTWCLLCGRCLTSPTSVLRKIGPVCAINATGGHLGRR